MHHLIHLLLPALSSQPRLGIQLQMFVCKTQQMRRQLYHILRHILRMACELPR
jgi:hypothetical protein